MNTIELKSKLIDQVKASTDVEALEVFYNYLVQNTSAKKVYRLSKDQSLALEEARAQYKRGEYISEEQSNQEIEEWLGK